MDKAASYLPGCLFYGYSSHTIEVHMDHLAFSSPTSHFHFIDIGYSVCKIPNHCTDVIFDTILSLGEPNWISILVGYIRSPRDKHKLNLHISILHNFIVVMLMFPSIFNIKKMATMDSMFNTVNRNSINNVINENLSQRYLILCVQDVFISMIRKITPSCISFKSGQQLDLSVISIDGKRHELVAATILSRFVRNLHSLSKIDHLSILSDLRIIKLYGSIQSLLSLNAHLKPEFKSMGVLCSHLEISLSDFSILFHNSIVSNVLPSGIDSKGIFEYYRELFSSNQIFSIIWSCHIDHRGLLQLLAHDSIIFIINICSALVCFIAQVPNVIYCDFSFISETQQSVGRYELINIIDIAQCCNQFEIDSNYEYKSTVSCQRVQWMFSTIPLGIESLFRDRARTIELVFGLFKFDSVRHNINSAFFTGHNFSNDILEIVQIFAIEFRRFSLNHTFYQIHTQYHYRWMSHNSIIELLHLHLDDSIFNSFHEFRGIYHVSSSNCYLSTL
jgi:hypothetical protein